MKTTPVSAPKPTEFELEVLRHLWAKPGSTVREVFEELRRHRELGYTTVLKTMQIMAQKGLVRREESEKAHFYHAAHSEEQTQKQMLKDMSDRLFSGSAANLVLRALSTQKVNAEELRLIRKLIEHKESRS